MATKEQVYEDLSHLSTLAHANVWATLGGEPLLNKNLVDIIEVARMTEIADTYEVWTNGLLLGRQPEEFWRMIDSLVVSRYPDKLSDLDVDWVRGQCDKHGIRFHYRDERPGSGQENFMTFLEPTPTGPAATQFKYNVCSFRRGHNFAASYGFFFMCCCGPHIPLLVQGRTFGDDGVRIEGLTEEGLLGYINRSEPLGACTHCAGRETAKRIPWSEERHPLLWIERSSGR